MVDLEEEEDNISIEELKDILKLFSTEERPVTIDISEAPQTATIMQSPPPKSSHAETIGRLLRSTRAMESTTTILISGIVESAQEPC